MKIFFSLLIFLVSFDAFAGPAVCMLHKAKNSWTQQEVIMQTEPVTELE